MKHSKKIIAGMLVTALCASMIFTPAAQAAPPAPKGDEAMYINLDFYGGVKEMSVVKSYSLNGCHELTDYGYYDEVMNMSNYVEPKYEDGKVTFQFDEDVNRFYFEGKLKDTDVVPPWSFDVSYKLNGVDSTAEDLVGKQGLVEINIDAIPNPLTSTYFRNNMILSIATVVNADETLSVEAPGAQVQTIGNLKAIVFMALPAEEQHFTLRLGSDDFSFPGLMMMMMPATVSQLEDIKELKEAKEKVEDSADAISDSLDVILGTLEGMQGSLNSTANGLAELDQARDTISQGKGEVYDNADQALAHLDELVAQLEKVTPHLQQAESMVGELNTNVNDLVSSLSSSKENVTALKNSMESLKKDIKEFRDKITDLQSLQDQRTELVDDLLYDLRAVISRTNELSSSVSKMNQALGAVNGTLTNLPAISQSLEEAIGLMAANGDMNPQAAMKLGEAKSYLDQTIAKLPALMVSTSGMLEKLTGVLNAANGVKGTLDDAEDFLDDLFRYLDDTSYDLDAALKHFNQLNDALIQTLSVGEDMIDQTVALNDTINKYEPDLVAALKDAQGLSDSLSGGMSSLASFLSSVEALLKQSGGQLDAGTEATLNGLIKVLQQSVKGLAQTGVIRGAKDTIRDLINSEWDKFSEEKNGLLNIDTDESPVSFTSALNPAPEGIQIILRTEEITEDSVEDLKPVDEDFKAEGNFFTRFLDIFKQIWNSIVSIFQ